MSRPGLDFRLATIVLLLTLGAVVLAALVAGLGPAESATLPAAGLLLGGLYLAWEEVGQLQGRRR